MTKIFNFALKIKGGGREGGRCEVLRPCHPPQNLERAQNILQAGYTSVPAYPYSRVLYLQLAPPSTGKIVYQ